MRVRVFGRGRIEGRASLSRRDRVVLAALVADGGDIPADRLCVALYGQQPPPTWRKVVQGSIVRLRQSLGARAIETTPDGYRLVVGDDDIDVRRFERLGRDADELVDVGQAGRAVVVLREALEMVTGEPFIDLDDWPPGRTEALRLVELRRRFEERLVEALLRDARAADAANLAETLANREPFREQLLVTAVDSQGAALGPVQTIDTSTGEVLDSVIGATTAAPTGDPTRITTVFADGSVGEYDISARTRSGSGIDPGFTAEGIAATPHGVLVWAGGRLRAIDHVGTLTNPSLDEQTNIIQARSPDPDHLFTLHLAGFESQLRGWDPRTGGAPGQSMADVVSMDAAADVVVGNMMDGQIVALDADTLDVISAPFPGVNGQVHALDLSADGNRLAVTGPDDALRLYDVDSRTMYGDEIPVRGGSTVLRDEGLEVAAVDQEGVVIWDLDPARWVSAACELAGRNLTRGEWNLYVGDLAPYHQTCPGVTGG